jgi:PAS domain S-box/diguanylate cyclase (GGDEF) domain/uncharacterized domain HDIG
LHELGEIHHLLLNSLPDPVSAVSQEGRYLYVNRAFAEGEGLAITQILGKTIWDLYDREEANKRFEVLNDVFQSGEEKVIEMCVSRSDNNLYFITTLTPIFNRQTKVVGVIYSSKDITKRKQMEMTLRENEEKFRVFFKTSKDSVFITSQDGYFVDFNDSMLETFGYNSREELQAVSAEDLYQEPEERAQYLADIKTLGSTKDYPVKLRKKDGTVIDALINTVLRKDRNGKIIGCQGMVRDITTQKLAEQALQESEAKYRLLVDHSYDLIWNLSRYGILTYISPSWERTTGHDPSSIIGTFFIDMIHPEDVSICKKYMRNMIKSKEVMHNLEYRVRHADGKYHWHIANGISVLDQSGKFISLVGISRDITEQKLAEEKLLQSEEKYRLLVSQMKQGLAVHEVICDESGKVIDFRFLYANEQYENMTGFKRKNILGKTVREIWPEKIQDNWIQKYGHVALTGEIMQCEKYFKLKKVFYNITAYSHQSGQFAVIITDITEQKNMEKIIFEEKELLEITLLSVGDGVITTDNQGKVNLLNKVAEQLTGWTWEEAYGKPFEEVFHIFNEYTHERYENYHIEILKTGKIIDLTNHTILISRNGLEIPIEDTAAPIRDEGGNINGMVLVFRDCTEKKKKQERIEYLSFHDSLTGVYNRRFFEEELKRLDVKRNLPVTLVMADVNGLKLANDAFGHSTGDKLLQKAAEVMKNECRSDDIIARIGGDEFVILLPRTTAEQAATIVKRINDTLSWERTESNVIAPFVLSISFGWETKLEESQDMSAVFKKAEDHMYRRKLSESTSMRHETIKVIIQTLYEKSEREQQHSVEVSEICQAFGAAMELSVEHINELRTAGLMHDIGKIVLNDHILDKPGDLTDSEWFELKRHAETGYRILESVKEFSQLAEYVLAHHERWDGKGYPKGLRGKEIPLEARIIAIADSYNAMVSDRPYRKALSKEEAIEEILKNTGTQFDPVITKVFVKKVLEKE